MTIKAIRCECHYCNHFHLHRYFIKSPEETLPMHQNENTCAPRPPRPIPVESSAVEIIQIALDKIKRLESEINCLRSLQNDGNLAIAGYLTSLPLQTNTFRGNQIKQLLSGWKDDLQKEILQILLCLNADLETLATTQE